MPISDYVINSLKLGVSQGVENLPNEEKRKLAGLVSYLIQEKSVYDLEDALENAKLLSIALNKADLPKNGGGGTVCPEPAPAPAPSDKMLEGMAGIAAAVCGAAVTSGSFVVGAICGLVVVFGILKAQGK